MQTLKTAAIVVLLMTVMYGAYVSLTTPPEPLPADVEDMLVINDQGGLAIDVGLPESLGEMSFNAEPAAEIESLGSSYDAVEFSGDASAFADDGGVTAALNDQGVQTSLSDAGPSSFTAPPIVQPADQSVASSNSVPSRSYPQTNNTFELPDPNSVVAGLNPRSPSSTGIVSPSVNPSALPSDLALTSGTSDTQLPGLDSSDPLSPSIAATRTNLGLANAIATADAQYADDKRMDALATLSLFYNTPNLSGEQRSELLTRLDPLAREVIYSKRHLLEQPYRVGQNETLLEVATRFEVPWQLLANINQIEDPVTILPGTELKVVRGPFRAEVNLSLKELTLFLGDMYAGRFPIGVGNDPPPKPGTFTIQDKQTNRTFYDAAGSPIPPGSRDNPYGEVWLDLGGQLCIHGSPSTTSPSDKGCISLAADYADDLFGILSQGSSVTIRR